MDTHSMIFVAVDKLVSPSSSVDGDQLDEFPNHWQPRFSAQFLLRRTSEGGTGPPPPNRISVRSRLLKPGVCCLARVTYETRCFLIRRASISRVTNRLDDPRFCWSRDRLVAQLFFGSNPVLDIFSVFAAALKIQLISPGRAISSSDGSLSPTIATSLLVRRGPERRPTSVCEMWITCRSWRR